METPMPQADSDYVSDYLAETVAVTQAFAADKAARAMLVVMAEAIARAMQAGGKLLVAGNGGSAGDAQHIAGEFISRLMYDRAPLPAIALTTDSSVITATGNDYGYEYIFERQVEGLGKAGDVFLGISTSGSSRNVVLALSAARARGLVTLGFTGARGGSMAGLCDLLLSAPSPTTALVQQIHITAAHIICALVERTLFPHPDE
jgi:D-sedoheptulose 7-phosphate isomerase